MTDSDDLVALMPFAAHLGLRIVAADAEQAEARLDWAPHL